MIIVLTLVGVSVAVGVLLVDPNNAVGIAVVIMGFLTTTNAGLFSAHRSAQATAEAAVAAEQAANAAREAAIAAEENRKATAAVRGDLKDVHNRIQGRMDDLLEASGKVEHAKGHAAATEEAKIEAREVKAETAAKETTAAVKETTAAVEEIHNELQEARGKPPRKREGDSR